MRTSNLKNVGGHATYKDRCVLNKIELRKKEGCVRMLTTKPRGTNDLLPQELEKWHYVENIMREVATLYGYQEIRTPIFEHTELFQRGVGETTDIVEKEMYTFLDRGKRSLTLRPEATASTVRAFLENKLYADPLPVKLYYLGPMFRYDRPQAGRYRQFHQFGVEVFGSQSLVWMQRSLRWPWIFMSV